MGLELLLVVAFVAVSLLALVGIRSRVPVELLKEHHDVAGACFAVIGGLYGIVLAFVLVSSWERFEQARVQAEVEANALTDLFRHGAALPAPDGEELRALVLEYARSVAGDEWPAMADGLPSERTASLFHAMWQTLLAMPAGDAKQVALYQNTLSKMDDFADARRDRLLYARVGLPRIVWVFLIASGVVTVAFSYFFGVRQVTAQLLMTAALAGTIGAALVLIAEMQTPFTGSVQVPPYGFTRLAESAAAAVIR